MLLNEKNAPYFLTGYFLFSLILFLIAGYAYRVNARRSDDDPEKQDFHFGAVFLVPVTWPMLLAALIVINVLRAIAYSISLFVVLVALVVIREAPQLIWLDKFGNKLLKANTLLIQVFFGKPIRV